MLHADGSYILPDNVPANEFLNLEGDKMSTSRKWSVEMEDYFAAFPGKEDVLRYVLTAIAPESKDADFSWRDFQARNNSELVAILGNFVNRVLVLSHKFYDGVVPPDSKPQQQESELGEEIDSCRKEIDENIREFKFREALFALMNMARAGNKYLADNEPWKTVKTDAERTATVMRHSIQLCSDLAWWMMPFMPYTAEKLYKILNLTAPSTGKSIPVKIETGHKLGEAVHLFSNIEDEAIEGQLSKLRQNRVQETPAGAEPVIQEAKAMIAYDDFAKMDLRIGTILEAEKVKKADKLLQLKVDLGFETRTVVSGIAKFFQPEELPGRQVAMLVNLEPRVIRGIESKGMILMVEDHDGKLRLLSPAVPVQPGSGIS